MSAKVLILDTEKKAALDSGFAAIFGGEPGKRSITIYKEESLVARKNIEKRFGILDFSYYICDIVKIVYRRYPKSLRYSSARVWKNYATTTARHK